MPDKPVSEKITLKITLFPPFSKKSSKDEMTMSFETRLTVKDLLDYLARRDDHFKTYLGDILTEQDLRYRALVIHNDQIASLDQILRDGDHVKFLHPLQGG